MQLTIERAVLESLREQAGSASHLVGRIAERAADHMVEQLSDEIDAIFHQLSELLGSPHLIAANARSTFASGVVTRDVVRTRDAMPELVTPDAPATSGAHRFLLGSSTPCAAHAIERGASSAPEPIVRVIVFADDESTQPHKVRADARQARGHRAMSSDSAGASLWWHRAAAVVGLLVLIELVFRVLSSCGGAR